MDQVVSGTVQGNTIVLDGPLSIPDGQSVEVVVRETRTKPSLRPVDFADAAPPTWWSEEDDRILEEIYRARKRSTRPEIAE
jgi:hypothetical protein